MPQTHRAPDLPTPESLSPSDLDARRSATLSSTPERRRDYRDIGAVTAIVIIALMVGCVGVSRSGPLWVDAPQYANAAAMIRDWVRSGQLLHPFEFARQNYAQYPAFSIPYHPPGYPAMLGAFFLASGVSYESARVFIALLLGVAGCGFFAILRRFAVDRGPAFASTVLLITMPEVAKWSRDTMSEIPALAFVLLATFGLLRWLETSRYRDAFLAFGFATLAFFSKLNVIGALLAWPVWVLLRGQWRKLVSPSLLIPACVFATVVVAWTNFFIPFARFETQIGLTPAELAAARMAGSNFRPNADLWTYLRAVPDTTGWVLLIAALIGSGLALRRTELRRAAAMWIAWFAGYLTFLLVLPLHFEARYFTFALPAIPALVALIFLVRPDRRVVGMFGYALVAAAFIENIVRLGHQTSGVVGYESVARRLASLNDPGNVLVSTPFQNDLIFRYRAASPNSKRHFVRGDRSITIRLSDYVPAAIRSRVLVSTPDRFADLVRRGRVRYVVTLGPRQAAEVGRDTLDEMVIAARSVAALPGEFAPVDSFFLDFQALAPEAKTWIYIWAYRHPLPEGPSEIPILIPTARFTFRPGD